MKFFKTAAVGIVLTSIIVAGAVIAVKLSNNTQSEQLTDPHLSEDFQPLTTIPAKESNVALLDESNNSCIRTNLADRALLPEGACDVLGDWWKTDTPPPQWNRAGTLEALLSNPWFDPAGLRIINAYGATPNTGDLDSDGIPDDDDTIAIQAALDSCHDAGVYCTLIALPGIYDIEEVYPDTRLGVTFFGGGVWGLKRLPYAFYEDKYGPDPSDVHEFARSTVMINFKSHYICHDSNPSNCDSRVYYRCDGPAPCPVNQIIGMTLDGNVLEQRPDYATHYSQQWAHLIQVGNIGTSEVQTQLEISDSLLLNNPGDGIAADVNATIDVKRIVCDGVFRGCINNLHSNSLVTIEDMYVTSTNGLEIAASIDGEPQGVSQGTDPVTGEDAQLTKRAYWTVNRSVLAASIDWALESSSNQNTLVGGWFRAYDTYLLRPRFNITAYRGEFLWEGGMLRTCFVSSNITRDPGQLSNFGDSGVRWSRDVTLKNTIVRTCKPSDTEIASAWILKPTLSKLWVYGIYIEQSHPTTSEPDRSLVFDNVQFVMDDPRPVDSRVRQVALYYYNGDASQNHTTDLQNVTIGGDWDWGINQWQGGSLYTNNTLVESPITLCSYSHPSGNYAYTAYDELNLLAGSEVPVVCNPNNGTYFNWTISP